MKNKGLTFGLTLVLSASSVSATLLALWHVNLVRQIQTLQRNVGQADQNRALAVSLGNEAMEYARKNPAIRPILESAAGRPAQSPGGTAPRTPTTR